MAARTREELLARIVDTLQLIRIYTREPSGEPDFEEPIARIRRRLGLA